MNKACRLFPEKILLIMVLVAFCFSVSGCTFSPSPLTSNFATINGTVFGALENTVVLNAKVTAVGNNKTYKTQTDFNGQYSLELPEGNYHLTVTMETFSDVGADVVAQNGKTTTKDFEFVSGTIIDFPATSWIWGINAITEPLEADYRSQQFSPDSQIVPLIKFDNVKNMISTKAVANGYKCWVEVWCIVGSLNGIDNKGMRVYKRESTSKPFTLIASVPYSLLNNSERYASTFKDFSSNLNPGDTSELYSISYYGDSGETTISASLQAFVLSECTLLSPASAEIDVSLTPTFSWNLDITPINKNYNITVSKYNSSLDIYDSIANATTIYASINYDASWEKYQPLEPGTKYLWGLVVTHTNSSSSSTYSGSASFSYTRTFETTNPL